MAGMSPAYVQKQLGHSSIAITVDIYGHWVTGEGRKGLEAALAGGAETVAGEGKIVPFPVP
jgi:integrase